MGFDDTWNITFSTSLFGLTTLTYVESINAGEKWHLDIGFLVPGYMRVASSTRDFPYFGTFGVANCENCSPFLTFNLERLRFEVEGGGFTLNKDAWKQYTYNLLFMYSPDGSTYSTWTVILFLEIKAPPAAVDAGFTVDIDNFWPEFYLENNGTYNNWTMTEPTET